MLGRPLIDLPPPPAEILPNLEGLDGAAMAVCLVGAKDAREDEALGPRELRDALETLASVVRLRAAMSSVLADNSSSSTELLCRLKIKNRRL